MITKVVLAKLSPTMDEGTIVKWNKKEGDPVKVGDVLAEIETDKANMEMEALGSGVLRKVLVPAGGKAPVGALIGVIAEPNEDIAPMLAKAGPAPSGTSAAPETPKPPPSQPSSPAAAAAPRPGPQPAAVGVPPAGTGGPADAAAAAAGKAAPSDQPASTAEAGRTAPVPPPPPRAAPPPVVPVSGGPTAAEGGRIKASPLARSMAAQHNIPLQSVTGSGPGGRIIKRDIEAWSSAPAAGREEAARPAAPAMKAGEIVPLSNMRKTIARRLAESAFTAPHFYVTVEVDMDAAVEVREQLLRGEEVKVSYNDLIVKACAKALGRFPMVNASWAEDKIVTHGEVHMGIAVAIPDGLITPVVRDADRKSVTEIAREVKELAGRARERKLRPEEYQGSTFTVSNLGMYDVTEFTAIINPPESAILAVGAVRKLPVVKGDSIAVGHRMMLTLSCDHRVVDGALGAQFLGEVRRLLENPVSLFV